MTWIEYACIGFIAILVLLLGCAIYDAATAKPARIEHCVVSRKEHRDAWTEVTVIGNEVHTTHHDEEWWISCYPKNYMISVSKEQFESIHEKQAIDIMVSIGGLGGEHLSIAPAIEMATR